MEEEKKEYWTESTLLKERGWSKGRIAKLLKNPDKLVPNPHYRTASKMRLYSQSRVLAAEASPEFIAFKTSAPTRAEKAATQQQRQINESSFPETFCRDMPEKLWLALSPRPEFEAEAIEIVVQIALAALDARAGRRRHAAPRFDQVERIFDIWHGRLNLETGAGVEAFVYIFTEAIAPNGKKGFRLADRRGYALDRLNQISTRQWSVGPSFFQQQISRGDEWLYFAR